MSKKKEKDDFDDVLNAIHKEYGVDSLRMGIDDSGGVVDCPAISTRCLSLDEALGIGGIPQGRITEIFGPEASGKTTLALTVVAEAQSCGGLAAFIDAEHAVDKKYAKNIGVDLKRLLFSQPDSGEQALSIAEKLIMSGKVSVVVIDSVAALVSEDELAGELTDRHIAPQARLMSSSLRRLKGIVNKSNTALVFINQIREKTNISYGNPEITPGGRALKFYSSVRIDIRRIGGLKDSSNSTNLVGNEVRVKVIKNKVAPPFKTCEFTIIFGEGISMNGDLLNCGLKHKLVSRNGSWYCYNDHKIAAGWINAARALNDMPEIRSELLSKIKEKIQSKSTTEVVEDSDTEDITEEDE